MNKKRTTTTAASETDEAAERRRYLAALTARLERVRIESQSWPSPWTEEWKKILAEGELR
jgi:hypothetical protein